MNALNADRTARDENEATIDRLLLLFLIANANRVRALWGKTKLEKLAYCSQYAMMKGSVKGFNYYFYRWHHGPFSDQIYDDLDRLSKCGFVKQREEGEIVVTPPGQEVLTLNSDILNRNQEICDAIGEVVSDYKTYTADQIKDAIYGTLVYGSRKRYVRDTKLREPLLYKLPKDEAKVTLRIDGSKLETLLILFTPKFYDQIMKARADKVILPYEPLP